jgi:hypothetical protein
MPESGVKKKRCASVLSPEAGEQDKGMARNGYFSCGKSDQQINRKLSSQS